MKVTFEELRQKVALFAAAMRKMGVKQGDRVVGKYFWFLWFCGGETEVEGLDWKVEATFLQDGRVHVAL